MSGLWAKGTSISPATLSHPDLRCCFSVGDPKAQPSGDHRDHRGGTTGERPQRPQGRDHRGETTEEKPQRPHGRYHRDHKGETTETIKERPEVPQHSDQSRFHKLIPENAFVGNEFSTCKMVSESLQGTRPSSVSPPGLQCRVG